MRFKLIRQKLGITQTDLAEQLGTSQVMIYRIEKGEKIMSSLGEGKHGSLFALYP